MSKTKKKKKEEVIAKLHGLALEHGYDIRLLYKTDDKGNLLSAQLDLVALTKSEIKSIYKRIKEVEDKFSQELKKTAMSYQFRINAIKTIFISPMKNWQHYKRY